MRFDKLIGILLVLWSGGCHSPEPDASNVAVPDRKVAVASLVLQPEQGLFFYEGVPFSGTASAQYANGSPSASTQYLFGKKHGVHQQWFPNGQLSFQSEYQHGKKHGTTTSWWQNGQKRSTTPFKSGVVHGQVLQWYKSGTLFKRLHLEEGKENGLQQSFRENGKLFSNYEAKNGRVFGLKRAGLCYQLDDEEIQL